MDEYEEWRVLSCEAKAEWKGGMRFGDAVRSAYKKMFGFDPGELSKESLKIISNVIKEIESANSLSSENS